MPFSMHNRYLSWLFLGAALALISLRAQAPGSPIAGGAEQVLAARVTGLVQMTVGGQTSSVKTEDRVPTSAKIVTAKDASIVLVFSNGATTQLGSDTELVIEEFLQDPFASTVRMADLAEEPSRSRTRLALNRGELVGNVKKLKHAEGSSYTVVTPVGAAGIRGTTFRIVFRPVAVGQAFGAIPQQTEFSLVTLEGDVSFQQGPLLPTAPVPGGGGVAGRPGISVRTGQQIVLNLTVSRNPAGQFSLGNPPSISTAIPMAPATAGQMAQAVQNMVAATTGRSFVPVATRPGAPATLPGSNNSEASATPSPSSNAPGGPNLPPPKSQSPGATANPSSSSTQGPGAIPPPRVQPAPRTTPLSGER